MLCVWRDVGVDALIHKSNLEIEISDAGCSACAVWAENVKLAHDALEEHAQPITQVLPVT